MATKNTVFQFNRSEYECSNSITFCTNTSKLRVRRATFAVDYRLTVSWVVKCKSFVRLIFAGISKRFELSAILSIPGWQHTMSKRKSKIQVWAEYVPVMLAFEILSLLPRWAALTVAIAIARTAFLLVGNLRKVGMRNLEIAFPEMAEAERLRILKGSIQNLGRVLGEMSQFHKLSPADVEKLVEYSDPNTMRVFAETRKQQRGVLITTGHLGNWEMLVYSFAALVQPMSYLARPLDNPLIENLTV